jgi:DNA/RNA endonuclease YhcR with UshA esterase domain
MATEYDPRIGDWYKNVHGDTFEIVAIDRDDGTLEIQYFDGTIEELELESWQELPVEPAEPP